MTEFALLSKARGSALFELVWPSTLAFARDASSVALDSWKAARQDRSYSLVLVLFAACVAQYNLP